MKIVHGLVYDPDRGFEARTVYTCGEVIAADGAGETLDAAGCYVIPGLLDLHFHGCVGEDFSDATPDGLQAMADYQLSRGVTYICPAGMTLPEEQLDKICRNAARHKRTATGGAELVCINLEGPFLSMAKKGAQNGDFLHRPDVAMFDRLQASAEGLIKLMTVAPEEPHAMEFIRHASRSITVSVGHTTANYETARAAYEAGARQATHLYNGMPGLHHRDPAVIGAAFDCPDARVELICDGVHIQETVVRMTFRLFGRERVILISDSLRATGMPDGQYPFGGQEIEVHGNRATLLGRPDTLAGSVTDLMGCVRRAVDFGIPLADAVRAASTNPAQALGLYDRIGSLEVGKDASLVLLDQKDLSVKAILFHGELVKS